MYLLGGPIILTLPHMLGAAAEYRTVGGLNPDEKKHVIFADIEPVNENKNNKSNSLTKAKCSFGLYIYFRGGTDCMCFKSIAEFWISNSWCKACTIEYVSEENPSN